MATSINEQLERFKTGFPYLKIQSAAVKGAGILTLRTDEEQAAIERWNQYLAHNGEVVKMVPASGAASRMFKALFAFVEAGSDDLSTNKDVKNLINNIHHLAFFPEADAAAHRMFSMGIDDLIVRGRNRDVIRAIIDPEGLNYGQLPKGVLKFHAYPGGNRTAIEEQLTEGAQTAANANGIVKVHFTVSKGHQELFNKTLDEIIPGIEARTGKKFEVSMSQQKPETDTIAVNPDNTPFLTDDGKPLMRPGGHGALIENLGDINSAVVMIKNIDNVVPDSKRSDTIKYKQVLGGILLQIHDQIESYLITLNEGLYTPDSIQKMKNFIQSVLCITLPDKQDEEMVEWIKDRLNRPLRVCGMVKNEGEPGGGPYLAADKDGNISPQILESHQIDPGNDEYKKMVSEATHFNPVDLVCYIQDIHHHPYRLSEYIDPATGFISNKSSHGRELKALELPGLWNGAMSGWNTVFVEVPITTFNPVKTVNDLLRPMHQA